MQDNAHLFSTSRPPSESFAANAESTYSFLNRSTRPEFATVRERLERWFSRYPESERADLAARFRSDNTHHRAAYFELFIHELLLCLGCSIEVHPSSAGRATRPDFLATGPDGRKFYLEASVISGKSAQSKSAEAVMDQALDVFERIKSPDFTLGIAWDKNPTAPLAAKAIARQVERWVATLDPDSEYQKQHSDGYRDWPRLKIDREIGLEFEALAKAPARRGGSDRPIGFWNPPGGWNGGHLDIRGRIKAKVSKYGSFGIPYLLALQMDSPTGDDETAFRALFGDEVVTFFENRAQSPRLSRKANGAWTKRRDAYANLSGTLFFWNLRPWTRTEGCGKLYHNPWAKYPYDSVLNRLSQARITDGRLEHKDGALLHDILGLV